MFGRLERVVIKSRPGQAKVLGTIVCVGGAILLSFYHGSPIFGQSSLHWRYAENLQGKGRSSSHANNFILGPLLLIASTISWAVWFIIQVSEQVLVFSYLRVHQALFFMYFLVDRS